MDGRKMGMSWKKLQRSCNMSVCDSSSWILQTCDPASGSEIFSWSRCAVMAVLLFLGFRSCLRLICWSHDSQLVGLWARRRQEHGKGTATCDSSSVLGFARKPLIPSFLRGLRERETSDCLLRSLRSDERQCKRRRAGKSVLTSKGCTAKSTN